MTGKIIDRETNGFLLLIIPLAAAVVLLFSAWQWIILLIIVSLGLKVWQDYRWSKLSARINPMFAQLMQEHQGCLTPLDISLKTGLKQKTATEFLERKASEFGAQKKTLADKGTVYYFITASTLGLILDDSEPETEETEVKSLPSSSAVSFAKEEIPTPVSETETVAIEAKTEPEVKEEVQEEAVTPVAELQEVEIEVSAPETDAEVSSSNLPPGESKLEVEEKEDKSTPTTNLGQLLKEAESDTVDSVETDLPSETADVVASLGELNQADLAKRLEVSTSTIGKRKKGMDFTEWSRIKDPDGIAWKYNSKTDNFTPIQDK